MNIIICKNNSTVATKDANNAYKFTLSATEGSTIFCSINEIWREYGMPAILPIYEDLMIIALSVFAVDKRISRRRFADCWTRDLSVNIPVLDFEKWKRTAGLWNSMLSFLSGDNWNIRFHEASTDCRYVNNAKLRRKPKNIGQYDSVSLFSGGLDSFCGALELMKNNHNTLFVGHNEYPKLAAKQRDLITMIQREFPKQKIDFECFTAGTRAPKSQDGMILRGAENTSRSRSLLFLAAGISLAGLIAPDAPLFIPENGFIGINVPLTANRKGSCSTRTTHPHFLSMFNNILQTVGIDNVVSNFFAYMTKREIVESVSNLEAFKEGYDLTISCSHPCIPRWNKTGDKEYPKNCGYCYPCLIRKSSLQQVGKCNYSYDAFSTEFTSSKEWKRASDTRAVFNSLYRFLHSTDTELRRLIRLSGPLKAEEIDNFLIVYKKTMTDLYAVLQNYPETLREYEVL